MSANTENHKLEASISKGYWFFFEVEGQQISVHASALSGRKRIWLDDEVVNDGSWRLKSKHQIMVNNKSFYLELKIQSIIKGELICNLYEGETRVASAQSRLKFYWRKAALIFLGSAIAGFLSGFWFWG